MPANLENSAVATGLEKVFSFQSQRRTMPKNVQTTTQLHLFSHASKIMLKILLIRLQQYVNWELSDVQAGFRKGREARDQIANICRFIEKAREFPQKSTSASLSMLKTLTGCITNNYGKFFKRGQYQTTLCVFCETCMQIKKHQLEPDMKQWTRSKLGNKYVKAVYCHPSYLIYMQSTSCDMWAGWSTNWNQDWWEK